MSKLEEFQSINRISGERNTENKPVFVDLFDDLILNAIITKYTVSKNEKDNSIDLFVEYKCPVQEITINFTIEK